MAKHFRSAAKFAAISVYATESSKDGVISAYTTFFTTRKTILSTALSSGSRKKEVGPF